MRLVVLFIVFFFFQVNAIMAQNQKIEFIDQVIENNTLKVNFAIDGLTGAEQIAKIEERLEKCVSIQKAEIDDEGNCYLECNPSFTANNVRRILVSEGVDFNTSTVKVRDSELMERTTY